MQRDIERLQQVVHDVLVIGGGIHGAAVAWQCARKGMDVALIERDDFGGATSANSLKIIHGGFRYLQHLNIKRMRESVASRKIMSSLAPHLVKPLRCVIPNHGWGMRSRWLMRVALLLNDIISTGRNKGIPEQCRIPSGGIMDLERCKRIFPAMDWSDKSGGAFWYDALAENSERMTLSFIQAATERGAQVANYLNMEELDVVDGKVQGCHVRDLETEKRFTIRANSVVVTGGAFNDRLLGKYMPRRKRQDSWAKAVNVVVAKKLLTDTAIGLTGQATYVDQDAVLKKKGRFFFFVPWKNHTMIGTTYTHCQTDPANLSPCREDIEVILQEINGILPDASLTLDDVTKVHVGLVPSYSTLKQTDDVQLVKETEVIDSAAYPQNGAMGLFCVKSVKYTTAPVVAQEVTAKIMDYLNFIEKKGRVDKPATHYIEQDLLKMFAPSVITILKERYGDTYWSVLPYLAGDEDTICNDPVIFAGEIDYFIEQEMAIHLDDVLFRRSDLGTARCPDDAVLQKVATRMATVLGWDNERKNTEIEKVTQSFYWQ